MSGAPCSFLSLLIMFSIASPPTHTHARTHTLTLHPHPFSIFRHTLETMLASFNSRIDRASLSPDLRSADLSDLARKLDMRTVSEKFALASQSPVAGLVRHDLVETLLIQVRLPHSHTQA